MKDLIDGFAGLLCNEKDESCRQEFGRFLEKRLIQIEAQTNALESVRSKLDAAIQSVHGLLNRARAQATTIACALTANEWAPPEKLESAALDAGSALNSLREAEIPY